MNRLVIIFLFLCAAAAGTWFWYSSSRQAAKVEAANFAEYLPRDTLMVISFRDLNGFLQHAPKTAIGRAASRIGDNGHGNSVGRAETPVKGSEEAGQGVPSGLANFWDLVNDPVFKVLAGDDFELAILNMDPDRVWEEPEKTVESSVLALATLPSPNLLETFFSKFSGVKLEKITRDGIELTKVILEDGTVLYLAYRGERVIIALDPDAISRSLAVKGAAGQGLNTVVSFQQAQKYWRSSGPQHLYVRTYIQVSQLQPLFNALAQKDQAELGEFFGEVAGLLQGIDYEAGIHGRDPGKWVVQGYAHYSYERLAPVMKEYVDSAKGKNLTYNLLAQDPVLYMWGIDFTKTALTGELPPDQMQELNNLLQDYIGISLQEFADTFGPQWGVEVSRIVSAGLFPVPRMVMALQVRDRKRADGVFARVRDLLAQSGTPLADKKISDNTIYFCPLTPGKDLQPAAVLGNKMFYISNNLSVAAEVVGQEELSSLPGEMEQRLGADASAQLRNANGGVLLLWPNRLAEELQPLLDWQMAKDLIDEDLLDGVMEMLRSTEVLLVTGRFDQDHSSVRFIVRDNPTYGVAER